MLTETQIDVDTRSRRSGISSGSGRVLRIFGFSDGEVEDPLGLFYTSDRVRVILGITELYTKLKKK